MPVDCQLVDTLNRMSGMQKEYVVRASKRSSSVCRVFTGNNCAGFTLLELMIAIIIIGILVGIAVPVYISISAKAEKAVATANERILCATMDQIWFSLMGSGVATYRDPNPPPGLTGPKDVDAKYLSYMVPKTRWVEVTVQAGRWRTGGIWKDKTLVPGSKGPENYYNWDLLYGNLAVLQDWYCWDDSDWRPNAHRDYVFVITLQRNGVARYTQFYQGKVDISGEFDWDDGWGHP